jgi:hypothetical protein
LLPTCPLRVARVHCLPVMLAIRQLPHCSAASDVSRASRTVVLQRHL